ncbi:hypothetical protein LTR62_007027 [Meristemomyces frigidus]|uniref:Multicopper oxidase n=1 Tax=Meristemomyces frigidus TaxID=1508187 RepID=A0AAN7TB66_9PEZI|nr:hypothetical protein LTR62_007027 [Meristemomyces frigidus]
MVAGFLTAGAVLLLSGFTNAVPQGPPPPFSHPRPGPLPSGRFSIDWPLAIKALANQAGSSTSSLGTSSTTITTPVSSKVHTATTTVTTVGPASITKVATTQQGTATINESVNAPVHTQEAIQNKPAPLPFGGAAGGQYHGPAFIPHGAPFTPALPQWKTNGDSPLGTFQAPQLPHWLSGPMEGGISPWGGRDPFNTNPYTSPPETGVTRNYQFTISEQTLAPDGVERKMLVVNGMFPGPTIEANWGDWIEVQLTNNLPTEGTTIHWHGLLQTATPWMDGIPAVQQCPIAPGSSFTYRFKADLYGTSWWHAHYSAQYAGGVLGPMIIYGPHDDSYDVDLGPVLLTDWYHQSYYDLVAQTMAPISDNALPPISNNNLINGKMNYPCANATGLQCTPNAGISKFNVTSGQRYRLRLINAGSEGMQKFSIDGAKLTVIANDFVPINPYDTDVVTLGIGQRSDVVFTANGKSGDSVWMRSTLGTSAFVGGCTLNDGISPEAVAAIYYQHADQSSLPTTNSSVPLSKIESCFNDDLSLTVPTFSMTPPVVPESTQEINITYQSNGTHNLFYMNNSTFRADYNDPVLLDAKLGKTTFPADYNVYDFGSSASIRFIVYNHAQTGAHPMHLHGHNFYVLSVGNGNWDGTVINAGNPQRRDVQLLPNALSVDEPGYMVIQFDGDNASVWPFHCHIAWHVSAGLYITILEGPDAIKNMQIPSTMAQTCRDWDNWTGAGHIVPEIDSGL